MFSIKRDWWSSFRCNCSASKSRMATREISAMWSTLKVKLTSLCMKMASFGICISGSWFPAWQGTELSDDRFLHASQENQHWWWKVSMVLRLGSRWWNQKQNHWTHVEIHNEVVKHHGPSRRCIRLSHSTSGLGHGCDPSKYEAYAARAYLMKDPDLQCDKAPILKDEGFAVHHRRKEIRNLSVTLTGRLGPCFLRKRK